MKTTVKASVLIISALFFFSLSNCKEPDVPEPDKVIDIAEVWLTAPVAGAAPAGGIEATEQFTGTVVWSPAHEVFQNATVYFAAVTLVPKDGYTFEGVKEDFFKVPGANRAVNDANSGGVSAIFPRTAGTADNPALIDIYVIDGIAPVSGGTAKTEISATSQYTGTISWTPNDNPFLATEYTANINLRPKEGFTFLGLPENYFTVTGATTANNDASSSLVTALFKNIHTHRWGDWTITTPATCTTKGIETRVCASDETHKETRQQIPINPNAHSWGAWTAIYEIEEIKTCSHNPAHTETRIAESFDSYLSSLSANTTDTPYNFSLKGNTINGLKEALINNPDKYVFIDLSGSNITTIPNYAFNSYYPSKGCSSLTGIIIPDSVTSIGQQAFDGCTSLTSVTIPNGVTSIGYGAFRNCTDLASVTIPNSVTSIGDSAFTGCTSLTSIVIPNGVTSIGIEAFSFCTSLTSVTIGNSVTSIRDYAFSLCTSLTGVTIPVGVTSIGSGAFSLCTSLTTITVAADNASYTADDGVLYNKAKTILYAYPAGKTDASFTIPNSVTSIGNYAFEHCTSLASVTIPNSVTSIGQRAFYYCTSLTSITIPNSVTSIGNEVFALCTITSITIPNSVTSIGDKAFYWTSLASVTIPNSVTSIGASAFTSCTGLTAINVDAANTNYSSQDGVLYNKNKTTLIQYPAGKISSSFTIPNSVTSIGDNAFYWTSLTSITFQGTITSANFSNAFGSSGTIGYIGDLRDKYLAGGPGTYTRPNTSSTTWTKQS